MIFGRNLLKIISISSGLILATEGRAVEHSFNLGTHNPRDTTIGINYLGVVHPWAVEIGLGQNTTRIDENDSKIKDLRGKRLVSEWDGKYYFMNTWMKPYVELGTAVFWLGQFSAKATSLGFRTGQLFVGAGIRLDTDRLYFYGSGQWSPGQPGYAAGVGSKL